MFATVLPALFGIGFIEFLVIAFILTVFYLSFRSVMRKFGPNMAERLPMSAAESESLQLLREVRQGIERMDQRVEMIEVLLHDTRNRLDAVEAVERGAVGSQRV